MATTLTDPILAGTKAPTIDQLKEYTILGGSEVVEIKLKEKGWSESQPVATMVMDFSEGNIVNTHIVTLGTKEVGKIAADVLWGPDWLEKSYAKIDPIDLAHFNTTGRMMSDWLTGDKLDWVTKIMNPESGKLKVINKLLEESLSEVGATKLWFRCHLSLDKGPKLIGKLGVAPISDIKNVIGNGRMTFPMIQIGRGFNLDLLPVEPEAAEFGTGFIPLFHHVGQDEPVYPTWDKVKAAIADHLNNACKPKIRTKYLTWKTEVMKGTWESQDPSFLWPDPNSSCPTEDDEEG